MKSSEQGAKEGAPFIAHHIIQTAERAFDDFAKSGSDTEANSRMDACASAWSDPDQEHSSALCIALRCVSTTAMSCLLRR